MKRLLTVIIFFIFLSTQNITAQDNSTDSAKTNVWTQLIDRDGVNISFIFYSKADSYHNGVVVKLINKNNHEVEYSFILIFRSEDEDKSVAAAGKLQPEEIKTGSNNNLFWVPFKNNKQILEVGITKVKINKQKME
jgi:hypothetical protein